ELLEREGVRQDSSSAGRELVGVGVGVHEQAAYPDWPLAEANVDVHVGDLQVGSDPIAARSADQVGIALEQNLGSVGQAFDVSLAQGERFAVSHNSLRR